jgi:hypothetical protein
MTFRIKKIKNYVFQYLRVSLAGFGYSFFGAWFQLCGLFWMVTGLPIFRPLPVLMKLNTESALLD